MPTSRRHSGYCIEPVDGQLELVLALRGGRLRHFRGRGGAWSAADRFGDDFVRYQSPSLLLSGWGSLEAVARRGDRLVHFWNGPVIPTWYQTGDPVGSDVRGRHAFIQGAFGANGNFEVVAPHALGGLVHFWRDNDPLPTQPWSAPTRFGTGNVTGAALIHGTFFGSLEVLAQEGDRLVHYWRDAAGWHGPLLVATGVGGVPALIQGGFGAVGNYEAAVRMADGSLAHFWRDNDTAGLPWHGPVTIDRYRAPAGELTLMQGAGGELHLLVAADPWAEETQLLRYRREAAPPWRWGQPELLALPAPGPFG